MHLNRLIRFWSCCLTGLSKYYTDAMPKMVNSSSREPIMMSAGVLERSEARGVRDGAMLFSYRRVVLPIYLHMDYPQRRELALLLLPYMRQPLERSLLPVFCSRTLPR